MRSLLNGHCGFHLAFWHFEVKQLQPLKQPRGPCSIARLYVTFQGRRIVGIGKLRNNIAAVHRAKDFDCGSAFENDAAIHRN